jgi:alkylated DNA repair dioxygenase AlkB
MTKTTTKSIFEAPKISGVKSKVSKQQKQKNKTKASASTDSILANDSVVWINGQGAKVEYFKNWMSKTDSENLLQHLMQDEDAKFKQYTIKMFNKPVKTPRLECAFCDPEINLKGYTHREIHPWTLEMRNIKERLEIELSERYGEKVIFEYALANIYKTGDHYIGYHADNENRGTTIASISLGAERTFKMQDKRDNKVVVSEILHSGSMLVMSGKTQDLYKHALPKAKSCEDVRINITFRRRR